MMLERSVSGLPVIQGREIVGLITESDIFRAFNVIMGTSEQGARLVMTLRDDDSLLEELTRRLRGFTVRTLALHRNPATGACEIVARVSGTAPSLIEEPS